MVKIKLYNNFIFELYKNNIKIFYLILFSIVNVLITFYIPKFTINLFGTSDYAQFIIFTILIDIILKLSLIDLSDLNLKFKEKKEFKKNTIVSFSVILSLNFIFIIFIGIIGNYALQFIILLLLNIFFSIKVKYLFIALFYENKPNYYSLYTILISILTILILFILFKIQIIQKYNLIYAYTLSLFLVTVISNKKVNYLSIFNFKIKEFKVILKEGYNLIKKNKYYIFFNISKTLYFPIFILTILYLNNQDHEISAASGISLAISLLASNIVTKTYFKYNLVNIKNYNNKFFYIYFLLGLIFFLIVTYIGIKYLAFFYFENGNKYFAFIYINFMTMGFFIYLQELLYHKIVLNNKIKDFFKLQTLKIFMLGLLFLVFNINNYDYKHFITINIIMFSIITIYSLSKTNK